MTRFNPKIGAGLLIGLGLLYLVIALATGHSARAEPAPDLRADGAGLDVWRTMTLMREKGSRLAVVDLRPADQFALYHLPGARSLPGGDADDVAKTEAAMDVSHTLLVTNKNATASKLVAELQSRGGEVSHHFLKGGVRAWYVAVELPVPLFSDQPVPRGFTDAKAAVRAWLAAPGRTVEPGLSEAIERLATTGYTPNLLAGKKKPKASGKKKISGGCG